MAGPGSTQRSLGTVFMAVTVLLVGGAVAVPWAFSEEGSDDHVYWIWGLQAVLRTSAPGDDGPRMWFDGDLDDQVEGLGLFRLAWTVFALGAAGAVVSMLMAFGAAKQRRRGFRWAGFAGFASTGLLLVGMVLFLVAMGNHITDDTGLTVRAHPEDHAWQAGLFVAVGLLIVDLVASILLVLGGRGVSEESQRFDAA